MKIDWSKAPEGTKGFAEVGFIPWPVWFGDDWYEYHGGPRYRFARYRNDDSGCFAREEMSNIRRRPELIEPEIRAGTSLPPVGTECEHQGGTGDDEAWYPVLILAHAKVDNGYVAVFQRIDDDMEISFSDAVFFRPTQTVEDIAAEEREREINELVETIVAHYEYPKGAVSYIGLAKALHSAGYRKTEQEQDQ